MYFPESFKLQPSENFGRIRTKIDKFSKFFWPVISGHCLKFTDTIPTFNKKSSFPLKIPLVRGSKSLDNIWFA